MGSCSLHSNVDENVDVQGASTGRLLSYSPSTGKTQMLASGFFFANGVALSEDESYVLVVETSAICVSRVWLTGPKVFLYIILYPVMTLTDVGLNSRSGPAGS